MRQWKIIDIVKNNVLCFYTVAMVILGAILGSAIALSTEVSDDVLEVLLYPGEIMMR